MKLTAEVLEIPVEKDPIDRVGAILDSLGGRSRQLRGIAKVANDIVHEAMVKAVTAALPGAQPVSEASYQEALAVLKNLSQREKIPLAIIGGAATIHHGYERSTTDIDVVVSSNDFQRLVRVVHEYNLQVEQYNPYGYLDLSYNGVPIDVVEEGSPAGDADSGETMQHPNALGVSEGVGFANLDNWVRMKLSAGRAKDDADLIEVLKQKDAATLTQIGTYITQNVPKLQKRFQELLTRSEMEKQQSEKRKVASRR
jgi:hypothetical protein